MQADRPSALVSANLAVRLLCELGLLVALAVWGFHTGSGLVAKVALGLGAPLVAGSGRMVPRTRVGRSALRPAAPAGRGRCRIR